MDIYQTAAHCNLTSVPVWALHQLTKGGDNMDKHEPSYTLEYRNDTFWGKTIILKPGFMVLGHQMDVMICEKYLSLWITNPSGTLTIINLKNSIQGVNYENRQHITPQLAVTAPALRGRMPGCEITPYP